MSESLVAYLQKAINFIRGKSPCQLANRIRDSEHPDADGRVFMDQDGNYIGQLRYQVLKRNIRVGLIEVPRNLQRRGYGTAILYRVGKRYNMPIVPLEDRRPEFWGKARTRLALYGIEVRAEADDR